MEKTLLDTKAICYSGFRDGQSPEAGVFPTYEEIKEDLLILKPYWNALRLYDCDEHAETVLEVIKNENLEFEVMLGAYIMAELNNYECPWGGMYANVEIESNKKHNQQRIDKLISLSNNYPEIITSVSAGNEASVNWTDHLVPNESLLNYILQLKELVKQPVTYCENYVPWLGKIKQIGDVVDFISIHTYPVWEYKSIDEALAYTIENYNAVASNYPNKQIVITEAGWATQSNGRGIEPQNVNEELQQVYIEQLLAWAEKEQILVYVFEAFDENWKGSDDPLEPEKHWGLFNSDRTPKLMMKQKQLISDSVKQ